MRYYSLVRLTLSLLLALPLLGQLDPAYRVKTLKVQVRSTMLASDDGVGEWGYAAVVDVDGRRILFDTGARPNTVLNNAKELHVDLSSITDVVLTHNHADHTGGLMTLRRAMMEKNPAALSRGHVGRGIFAVRRSGPGKLNGFMTVPRRGYEGTGGGLVGNEHPVGDFI